MRALLATIGVALAVPACAELPPSRNAGPCEAAAQKAAAPPPRPVRATTGEVESEPLPGSFKRYLLDEKRFSAVFPAFPRATEIGRTVTYEARNPAGALVMVACGPSAEDHGQIKRAPASAGTVGRIISESHPDFYGTQGYLTHVRLPDRSERVILFVDYGGRYCTATVEVRRNDETCMDFIESFRPEPVAP